MRKKTDPSADSQHRIYLANWGTVCGFIGGLIGIWWLFTAKNPLEGFGFTVAVSFVIVGMVLILLDFIRFVR